MLYMQTEAKLYVKNINKRTFAFQRKKNARKNMFYNAFWDYITGKCNKQDRKNMVFLKNVTYLENKKSAQYFF